MPILSIPLNHYSLTKLLPCSFGNTYPINSLGNIARQQRPVRGVQAVKTGQPHWTFGKRPPLGIPPGTTTAQLPLYRNNSLNTAFAARPQVYEVTVKLCIVKPEITATYIMVETLVIMNFIFFLQQAHSKS